VGDVFHSCLEVADDELHLLKLLEVGNCEFLGFLDQTQHRY
jgi:hypothetical protein